MAAWSKDGQIKDVNLDGLLRVRSILQRAALQRSEPGQLWSWLYEPSVTTGERPADLLARQEFDGARMLAVLTESSGLGKALRVPLGLAPNPASFDDDIVDQGSSTTEPDLHLEFNRAWIE